MLRIRIEVRLQDDLRMQSTRPLYNLIKVPNLEPKQNAMAGRRGIGINKVRMILLVPGM
jgi:hypothetical protein